MKNLISKLSLALLLASSSAVAAQFEIQISQPVNETASTTEFAPLLQKVILIDTRSKTLRLPVVAACDLERFCTESIHWETYSLTDAHFLNRTPSKLTAVRGSSQIVITSTADHSTLIQVVNSKGSAEARFLGSSAQPTRFLD